MPQQKRELITMRLAMRSRFGTTLRIAGGTGPVPLALRPGAVRFAVLHGHALSATIEP